MKIFPEIAGHHAAHQLISGRGVEGIESEVSVSYRLSDISQQSDPRLQAFKVSNCDAEDPTMVELKGPVSSLMLVSCLLKYTLAHYLF